jgi:hypothetical protein
MRYISYLAIGMLGPLVVSGQLFAQATRPPSLKDQLEAQYAPDTVLVVQKDGILGLAPIIIKTCAAKYQSGNLKPADAACSAPIKDSSRMLAVGERVNPRGIQVNLALETISVDIVECASCNNGVSSPSYKARIDFQFARGYLEKGSVSEIEDTIGQLLSIPQPDEQQSQGAQEPAEVITNNDVIKMVKAKLGDAIVISTIKSSACNFDTSVNGMVKLKEAAVSDPVILAMRDAQAAANAPANDPGQTATPDTPPSKPKGPPAVPGQLDFSAKHIHYSFVNNGHNNYLCPGTLSILPSGAVDFYCDQSDDPTGQGEQISLGSGTLKEAKVNYIGNLHLVSKTQGRFDFSGDRNDLSQALAKIVPLVQK